MKVTPLRHAYIAIGTGYGMDEDWRHGMYQGPLVVQYREWTQEELESWGWFGIVDHVARFETSTGNPEAIASLTTNPQGSVCVGNRNTSASP